jgi:hypothetical protein
VGLDHEPHGNQLRNKMIKNKMNNKNQVNDVNVIHKGKENTRGKLSQNITMHKNGLQQKKV